jgi:predicted ATPase/DNA-binding SARP family transcriptional activator
MLGTFVARNGDNVISRFRTRRVGMLLAYLAYHAGKGHDRAEIAELLWPDGDPDKSGANLRQALASLRRQIEIPPLPAGSVLRSANARLSIDPTMISVDVAEFERSLDEARKETNLVRRRPILERALALYGGELLPGYGEEWVLRERARLEDVYVHALQALAQCALEDGHSDLAIDVLHRSLAKDPYNERVHASVIRIHLESGQPASAMEHYRTVERRLAEELGVPPDEPLKALARQAQRALRNGQTPQERISSPATAPPPTIRLPVQLTRVFGRQGVLTALVDSFGSGDEAFATILGPAGVGKTTLAIAVARALAEDQGWHVGFVPMSDYGDASMVLDGVADAMGASRDHSEDVYRRIRSSLKPGPNIVILDNAEHILEGLAPGVAVLRQQIPELRLLVTSRQGLKVADERQFMLDFLEVPDGDERLDQLALVPSVALFVDRARAVQPDFGLTPRNGPTVAEICQRLDGLPLAIELAAGLAGVFTPSQMLGHLDRRFTMLKTRRRDAPLRHRSLTVALDYSYDTLSTGQKRFFDRLSVFRGGFSLEAATNLTQDSNEADTLQALLELQERSLIFSERLEDEGASPLFRMVESFREYGREHLSEGEWRENSLAHAEYFLSTLPELLDSLPSAERRFVRRSLLQGRANYWAAALWLLDLGRTDDVIRVLFAITSVGPLGKPQQAEFEMLRGLDPKWLSRRSNILRVAMMGVYRRAQDSTEAYQLISQSVELARVEGDPVLLIRCLTSLAGVEIVQSGPEAALEVFREIYEYDNEVDPGAEPGVGEVIAYSFNGLGTALWLLTRLEEAEAAFREGLRRTHEEPGEETHWLIRYNLSRVLVDQSRFEEAAPFIGDTHRIANRLQDPFGVSMALGLTARYRWKSGDLEGALEASEEAMTIRHHLGLVVWFASAIRFHGLLLAEQGEDEIATILLAASERHPPRQQVEIGEKARAIETIQGRLGPIAFRRAWERGLTMDLDGAFDLAKDLFTFCLRS